MARGGTGLDFASLPMACDRHTSPIRLLTRCTSPCSLCCARRCGGQVGSEVARRGIGLGFASVIAYDPYASDVKAAALGVKLVPWEEALAPRRLLLAAHAHDRHHQGGCRRRGAAAGGLAHCNGRCPVPGFPGRMAGPSCLLLLHVFSSGIAGHMICMMNHRSYTGLPVPRDAVRKPVFGAWHAVTLVCR